MATCCLLHLKEIGTCKVPFAGGHVVLDELCVLSSWSRPFRRFF